MTENYPHDPEQGPHDNEHFRMVQLQPASYEAREVGKELAEAFSAIFAAGYSCPSDLPG